MKLGICLAGAVSVLLFSTIVTQGNEPAPKDAKPVLRMEERRFAQSDARLIAPEKGSGPDHDIAGGQIVSQFRVSADGVFAYNGVNGKIPEKEITDLVKELAQMASGLTAAPINRSVAFYYTDANGKARCLLFTFPGSSPNCDALLEKLAMFKTKYAK